METASIITQPDAPFLRYNWTQPVSEVCDSELIREDEMKYPVVHQAFLDDHHVVRTSKKIGQVFQRISQLSRR